MKRALIAIAATIAGLYATLTYKAPPQTEASAISSTTTSTQPDPTASTVTTLEPVQTVDGPVATMLWGPVEVEINIQGTQIVGVQPVALPSGNTTSDRVEARAVPILETETLRAQSADVATVSGATLTSNAWRKSLQAALVSAGLAGASE